jgi:hypothetical protein
MGTTLRRVASLFVVCSLSVEMAGPASAVITDPQRAHRAMAYVGAQQRANGSFPGFSAIGSTADAVLDMAATGYGAEAAAIAFLRRQVQAGHVTTIGLTAKVVMAAVAAGRDPSTFAGTNLLGHITDAERPSGRYGDASVFDQALAILAIRAAGQTPDAAAVTWLANAQCPDGGWQFDRPHRASENRHCHEVNDAGDFFRSDTNTTAYAVMALEGLGASLASGPFPFFAALRDPTYGGWGYTWGFRRTDANSTALVIQAFAAHARPLPNGAMSGLRRLQYRCGAVAYSFTDAGARTGKDVGASIGAVLGFLREPLPVTPIALEPPWASTCGP